MIKICYIIGQLIKGGAEGQIYQLVKGIDKEKFCPIVISLSQSGYWANEIRKLNIQVVELQRRKHKEFTRLFKLIKLLKTIKPDIVHTQMFIANSYGRVAAIFARVPIIIGHELSLPLRGKDKNIYSVYIDKLLSLFSHGIICNSTMASNILIRKYYYNAKKVFTVHNGIVISDFLKGISPNSHKKSAQKMIGIVARLAPVKNHLFFLDMAKIILDTVQKKDIKFLIVGDGPLRRDLEEYSKTLGIKNYVIFTGERNDIPELMQEMDIFVMTSIYEGIPNTIMEAMMAGLPVVSTDVGAISEIVDNGETGFVCPSHDINIFAKKVISLINDENESRRMGENGKKKILCEYGMEKMVKKIEDIYFSILDQKHHI